MRVRAKQNLCSLQSFNTSKTEVESSINFTTSNPTRWLFFSFVSFYIFFLPFCLLHIVFLLVFLHFFRCYFLKNGNCPSLFVTVLRCKICSVLGALLSFWFFKPLAIDGLNKIWVVHWACSKFFSRSQLAQKHLFVIWNFLFRGSPKTKLHRWCFDGGWQYVTRDQSNGNKIFKKVI